ncbi:hypothetical protein BJY52DRAFT_1222275 [Lactarius psammicola]|nr:hypothetical protein BJY52DRAFT_1222275 [Lactarius psammicola]
MKSALLSIVSATLFVAGVSAQSLTVNTPLNVVVCQPLLITWTGGTAPYFLSVHPGDTPDGPALVDFGTQQGNSFTWTAVNFAVGTNLDITLRDSAGITSQSAPFRVQTGSDTGCLSGSSSSGGSTSPTGVSTTTATGPTPSTSTPTTPATTPTATTSATTRPSGSSTSSSSSSRPASSSTSTNAAVPTGVSYGAAGVLGAVVAAVLA